MKRSNKHPKHTELAVGREPDPVDPVVAVVAHTGKVLGGGLPALRQRLVDAGVTDPMWFEVPKSRKAPRVVREALAQGATLVLVWGGDGMVQQCATELACTGVPMAILPAGTANLLATNLGIPIDLDDAVQIALHGNHRAIDVATLNGEAFAVMGGAGFDGHLISLSDGAMKDKLGRLAYVRGTVKSLREPAPCATVRLDGHDWFEGRASCVLVGNVGTVLGGIKVFEHADPTDGRLDVGVVSADGPMQWMRLLGRAVAGADPAQSPLVHATQARKIDVHFDQKVRSEVDGSARSKTKHLKFRVKPEALVVCVPAGAVTDR